MFADAGDTGLTLTAEEIERRILFRDGLMLVIDKPAGVPVHRGPKGGHSMEDYFDALRFGLPRAPALAHRLDKDTSGCLVLGRHRKALAHLGLLFKHGKVGKVYWALVEGDPPADTGTIDLPLGRRDAARGWWMKPDPNGQTALTQWTVLGRSGAIAGSAASQAALSWLALVPLTGRTHQLRVHCAAMGWPIVGDEIYGTAPRMGGPGLHLHAREIAVPLYPKRDPVRVVAQPPPHHRERLGRCGWGAPATATQDEDQS